MKARLFAAGAVLMLALAIISAVPWQTTLAQQMGPKSSPSPSAAPKQTPPSAYVIARNPFILDSVAVNGPGRGQVAGTDSRLIGIVLGAHPGAIFADKTQKAVTLSVGDRVGKLTIQAITMRGVSLSDGSVLQVANDTTSYGIDQSVGATMPPITPGYTGTQTFTGIPAPQFPYENATPLPQSDANPWGASPYGNGSSGANPYGGSSQGATPHPTFPNNKRMK